MGGASTGWRARLRVPNARERARARGTRAKPAGRSSAAHPEAEELPGDPVSKHPGCQALGYRSSVYHLRFRLADLLKLSWLGDR